MSSADLHVGWCSHRAAAYAATHWHYTRQLPGGKRAQLGAWEGGRFVGAVVFSVSAAPMIARPFGMQPEEVCELARVALDDHDTPVSRILAIACRLLHREMPGLRIVVSFADTAQGHEGGIYKAAGWTYLGAKSYHAYVIHGETVHPRTLGSRYGRGGQSITWLRANVDPKARRIVTAVKHKYALGLDDEARQLLAGMAKPYRSRVSGASSTTASRAVDAGASPSLALQSAKAP